MVFRLQSQEVEVENVEEAAPVVGEEEREVQKDSHHMQKKPNSISSENFISFYNNSNWTK